MKIKNKAIRLLSSILLFPILSIISWASTTGYENMSEENLIAEYSQQEQERKNAEKSVEETKQQSEKTHQETSDKNTKKLSDTTTNATEKKQHPSKSTANTNGFQNNTSSTSTAPSSTNPSTSASTPTTSEPSSTDQSDYKAQVVKLCNDARQQAGVSALLNQNSKLQQAADIRTTEIKQSFSHTRPNGTTAYTVLDEVGLSYTTWGENIAYGQKTPQEVVNAWMNSPGHRANILNANFKEIAVGMKDYYWVQEFI